MIRVERIPGTSDPEALELSSPFLPGYRFTSRPDQLARQFGTEFVANLQQLIRSRSLGGPMRSTYGQHYVWVSEVEPARDATLEEVRSSCCGTWSPAPGPGPE